MDTLLSALIALIHWRLVLSTLASIFLAVMISNALPLFTAGYCLTLVILGVAFGIYWQVRADAGVALTQEVPEAKISAPVAFLGFAFIGLVCGLGLTAMLGSRLLAAAALLFSGSIVALWYRFVKRQPLHPRPVAFAFVSLLAGYAPLLFLSAGDSP